MEHFLTQYKYMNKITVSVSTRLSFSFLGSFPPLTQYKRQYRHYRIRRFVHAVFPVKESKGMKGGGRSIKWAVLRRIERPMRNNELCNFLERRRSPSETLFTRHSPGLPVFCPDEGFHVDHDENWAIMSRSHTTINWIKRIRAIAIGDYCRYIFFCRISLFQLFKKAFIKSQ